MARSTPFSGAALGSCPIAGHDPVPVSVAIRIAQAPSLFVLPVMQTKAWDCMFQVELAWQSTLPLQFTARVEPVVLDEDALANIDRWNPLGERKRCSLVGCDMEEELVKLEHVSGVRSGCWGRLGGGWAGTC